MTLEEAIAHAEEVAATRCGECSEEHEQLVEWLKELKRLKTENAKLRKENDDLTRLANIDAMMMFLSSNCLFKDCSECEVKPLCDEAVYLQGLYGIDKDLVAEVDMKAENEKLRELVRDLRACNGSCQRCLELMGKCEYEERMRELGIEIEVEA